MKKTLIAMALFYTFAFSESVYAQKSDILISKIQKEVKLIQTEIELDEKQTFEISNVMIKSIEKVKKACAEIDHNPLLSKIEISSIEEEKDKDLQACLSEEQWIIFNILREKMFEQKNRRQRS